MQGKSPKFATALATDYVQKNIQTSFFKKTYILKGACWMGSALYFQHLGVLGRAFIGNERPFLYILGSQRGKEESVFQSLESVVKEEILPLVNDKTTFIDLVWQREYAILNPSLDVSEFTQKYANTKIQPGDAVQEIAIWGLYGACLGLAYPSLVQKLFDSSYINHDKSTWELGYKLGVVSTPEQETPSFVESEETMVQVFHEFCSQFYPELMSELFA